MSEKFANRQREIQQARKGRPVLSLEFDVYEDGEVAMWAHTRHEIPFAQMQAAFEAIRDHLTRFIADGDMCPFNPQFVQSHNAHAED
jgi:hypothetical protein